MKVIGNFIILLLTSIIFAVALVNWATQDLGLTDQLKERQKIYNELLE